MPPQFIQSQEVTGFAPAGLAFNRTADFTATTPGTPADSQRARRARTSKPKVKTGCTNCKSRRIKCDETRPSCTNCVKSKKTCTGYPPPSRSARSFEVIRIAPKPLTEGAVTSSSTPIRNPVQLPPRRSVKYQRRSTPPYTPDHPNSSVVLYQPSASLPFDSREGLYFRLFREQTASELSGYFDSVFWSETVLQECHSEAAIRHAVIALGALYKTLEKSTESPPGSPSDAPDPSDKPMRHWEMALKQYSDACRALIGVDAADTRGHRARLMASVLLACFDSFVGDHKQAIVQIRTGLDLLEKLRAERRRAFLPRPEEPVEEELIQMFTRLAIQAKSYDMAFHFPHPWVVRLTAPSQAQTPSSPSSEGPSPVSLHSQDPIPERFSSLLEARLSWDILCERIFRFTETMFAYAQSGNGILPVSLGQHGLTFKQDLEDWSAAFDHILAARTAPGVSSQEKAGVAVLKMFQIMGKILFLMTFSDSEMQFDNFMPEFRTIVELALEVVGDEERRAMARRCPNPQTCHHHDGTPDIFGGAQYAARHIKPSFSADLGIVPPLFVVATKCRDPVVRRQAIQLLRCSSRREGMWDSELAAHIGMWITEIEEDGGGSPGEDHLPTPATSPRPSTASSSAGSTSVLVSRPGGAASFSSPPGLDFGDAALGPGGNARWDARRESQVSGFGSERRPSHAQAPRRATPPVPAERRVMVRAVDFDLRERSAVVELGTRGLTTGTPDMKRRKMKIMW